MTQKERETIMCALSNIRGAISELEYYKREGWLSDTGALVSAKSAEDFIKKILTPTKKRTVKK